VGAAGDVGLLSQKARSSFFEKKNQKNFAPLARGGFTATG
jgi:hypothetical protein